MSTTLKLGAFGEKLALALLPGSIKRKKGIDLWWPVIKGTVEVKTSQGLKDGKWEATFTYKQQTHAANAVFFCLDKQSKVERVYLIPNQALPMCLLVGSKASKWDKYRLF